MLTIQRAVTNVVPSSMTLALHVFRDSSLLSVIRQCVAESTEPENKMKIDLKTLEKQPHLLSAYAETLRFGVQIHITRSAPHRNLHIGKFSIPKNKLLLINTWLAHTDESVWNTKQGIFPPDQFWAQRFIVDPRDPTSGPLKKNGFIQDKHQAPSDNIERIRFSTEGLEGSWIPYGGMMTISATIGMLK